jgi:hypothetical protein
MSIARQVDKDKIFAMLTQRLVGEPALGRKVGDKQSGVIARRGD